MTATETPVVTRYRGDDYSEMTLQTARSRRPCVICREPIKKGSMYLFAVVRVGKITTRRHMCRACCLRKEGAELHSTWNRLLDGGAN